jgi:hypothetical protein
MGAAAACRQMAQWMTDGIAIPSVAVNLSARHFRESGPACDDCRHSGETGIPTRPSDGGDDRKHDGCRSGQHDRGGAGHRALGVGLSMDDFGTGFSTLADLVNLPLNRVKIDRSFVDRMDRVEESRQIVNAVIGMGRNLGMSIVAEGVETKSSLRFWMNWDARWCRDSPVSHPLEAEHLPDWVRACDEIPARPGWRASGGVTTGRTVGMAHGDCFRSPGENGRMATFYPLFPARRRDAARKPAPMRRAVSGYAHSAHHRRVKLALMEIAWMS